MASRGFTHESSKSTMPDGEENQWFTPQYIFDAIGLEYDLDPCSPGEGLTNVPAKRHLTIADDGLETPWGDGLVFMNPPYGKHVIHWMRKLAEHDNGIALIFARTETKWFQESIASTSGVCFLNSRVKFHQGGIGEGTRIGSPTAGSVLIAFGEESGKAVLNCGLGATFKYAL